MIFKDKNSIEIRICLTKDATKFKVPEDSCTEQAALISGGNVLPPNVDVAVPIETQVSIQCFRTLDSFGMRVAAPMRTTCSMRAKITTELHAHALDARMTGWIKGRWIDGWIHRRMGEWTEG